MILFKSINIVLMHFRLKLVVIALTNEELMKSEQPLEIFSSSNTNNRQLKTIQYIVSFVVVKCKFVF